MSAKSRYRDLADTCHLSYIPDGSGKRQRTYLIAIVDDYARMIVGARLFFEDTAYNFQKVLKGAVSTYGIPNKLYVDYAEEKTIPKNFRDAV